MADDGTLLATGFSTDRNPEKGLVRLSFFDDQNQGFRVAMAPTAIGKLVAGLLSEIESGSLVPIHRHGLRPGGAYAPQGYSVARLPDGQIRLTVHVSLPEENDRGVFVPIDLSRNDAVEIVEFLTNALAT